MTIPSTEIARPHDTGNRQPEPPTRLWGRWRQPLDPGAATAVAARVYAYDLDRRVALRRYFALLVLAVLIATLGLHKDSATIVLSAMLLEQVVMPIVAFALGLVTGEPRRQLGAAAMIVASAGVTLGLSWLATTLLLSDRSGLSGQIIASSSPNLTDLAVALIAGVAAGYVLIHHEALGALPGAVVGLALVAPLCSAGYLIAHGHHDEAGGALLLFVTNLAAIVFAASIVFALSGFLPRRARGGMPVRVRVGMLLTALAILAVALPLRGVTNAILQDARDESVVLGLANAWVAPTQFEVESVSVDGELVEIGLSGPTDPVTADDLAAEIARGLGRPIQLRVKVVRTTTLSIDGAPD